MCWRLQLLVAREIVAVCFKINAFALAEIVTVVPDLFVEEHLLAPTRAGQV